MKDKNTFIGLLLAIITLFIWGITFVCTKSLLKNFSALEALLIRFFIAYIALWIFCPKPFKSSTINEELIFVFAGLSGVTLYQFLENSAVSFTTASNVSIIVSICPIFGAIFSQIFLKEKHLCPTFLIGFLIAALGVILVSLNGAMNFSLNPKGDLLALISGLSWGVYTVFVSRINLLKISVLQRTRRTFFWALIFMIPLIAAGRFLNGGFVSSISENSKNTAVCLDASFNKMRFSSFSNWFNFLFLGLGASAFCFSAWNKACAYLGAVRTSLGIYMIPVVTIIFAYIFLGEKITLMGAAGAILTIVGLIVSSIKKNDES